MRLAEHRELPQALGLMSVPDHTTPYRFMRRLSPDRLNTVLAATPPHWPEAGSHVKATVGVDATGLASGAISAFVVKRGKDRGNGFEERRFSGKLALEDA